jgi:hypothetical protein
LRHAFSTNGPAGFPVTPRKPTRFDLLSGAPLFCHGATAAKEFSGQPTNRAGQRFDFTGQCYWIFAAPHFANCERPLTLFALAAAERPFAKTTSSFALLSLSHLRKHHMIAKFKPESRGHTQMHSTESIIQTARRGIRPMKWLLVIVLTFHITLGHDALRAQSRSANLVRSAEKNSCGKGTLPLTFREGLALVTVGIDEKPLTFIVDSAGTTIVNSDHVLLPVVQQIRASAVTVSAAEPKDLWNVVRVKSFTVGARDLSDSNLLSHSLRSLETQLGREVDGILGKDVLSLWDSVSLDYKHRVLVLERSNCPETLSSESLFRLQQDMLRGPRH